MQSTTEISVNGNAALNFAEQGYYIVPCHSVKLASEQCSCNKKSSCSRKGKHPRIADWCNRATDDEDQIRRWWSKWPDANVGILTGYESGLVVLDVDEKHDGLATLKDMAAKHPEILQTLTVKTGGGGLHLYFLHPGTGTTIKNRVGIGPGLDIRGDKGMVIAPPSRHASGNQYAVHRAASVADLPDYLLELMSAENVNVSVKSSRSRSYSGSTQEILKQVLGGIGVSSSDVHDDVRGRKNEDLKPLDLETLACEQQTAINDAIRSSIPSHAGTRNRQTFELARWLYSVPGVDWKTIDPNSLRPIVKNWHDASLRRSKKVGFEIHGSFTETWDDFRFGWSSVRCPVGMCLRGVVEQIRQDKGKHPKAVISAARELGYNKDRDMLLLLSLCFRLFEFHDELGFYLAASKASECLKNLGRNKDRHWCARRLKQLTDDGVLRVLEKGKPGTGGKGRSTTYLWTWQIKKTAADLSWLDIT